MKQMRKRKIIISALLLVFLLFGVVACGDAVEATTETTETTTQEQLATGTIPESAETISTEIISTESISTKQTETGDVTIQEAEPEVEDEEEPIVYPAEDYITTEDIVLDLEKAVYHIGKNVYVPGNVADITNATMNVIEQIAGLSFEENPEFIEFFSDFTDGKTHIFINRELFYSGQEWYTGLDSSEFGEAYAVGGMVWAAPGNLLLGNNGTIIHELCHALMCRQSPWYHGVTLNEGFAEYTTYLVLLEMEEKYPELVIYFNESTSNINNMYMEYEELYKQPMEYWLDNSYEYAGNGSYAVGFRFMAYLNAVYGDYNSWILKYEEEYPFMDKDQIDDKSPVEQRIAILKQTYGEDVLDNFYPWLMAHESDFAEQEGKFIDISNLHELNVYPEYNAIYSKLILDSIKYKDLYINLEYARKYIEEYKGGDASKLVLLTSDVMEVALYHADGSYTQVTTGREPISLEGIIGIKLVGEGTVNRLEISGFQQ